MGRGYQTTLGRSSWSGSRSTSHHFCQREGNIVIGNFNEPFPTRTDHVVTEVSSKAPFKEPGNECEGEDDEHEEEEDADDPGPRLGKQESEKNITLLQQIL